MMEKYDVAPQVGFDEDTAPMNFDFDDLDSDQQTLLRVVIDDSASMSDYAPEVSDSLEDMQRMFLTSKQVDEMVLGKTLFGDRIEEGPYCLVEDWDTSYSADGWSTQLYDAVISSVDNMKKAMADFDKKHFSAKGIIVFLSDGRDNDSAPGAKAKAKAAIQRILTDCGIFVYFIEFGSEARGVAAELGVPREYILKAGDQTQSPEERIKQLRAAFKFVSKSAISVSQGAKAPAVPNNTFFAV